VTISRIYKDFLIEDIIRESLKQGEVLTRGEIEERLEILTASNPTLSDPFTQEGIYETTDGEDSSASKVNKVMSTVHSDLSVVYTALTEQASAITSTYDSVNSEFKAIEKRIRVLEDKSRNLLIISKNAEGYLDFVSDNFSNKDKIDIQKSNIFADNKVGVVTLEPLTHSRISMPVIDSDLQFNVLTREQLQGVSLAPGSKISDAFTDQENVWIQRVQMARGVGAVTADLIVRVLNATSEVSKIVFKPATSDEGNISSLTVQYSDDGLNWFNPDGTNVARLAGDVTLIFSPVKASYWKFIFDKASYDEFRGDSYVYEFGAKTIQFYGVEYQIKENKLEGTFISKPLTGSSGNGFNRISLKVCESTPKNTNLNYFLAALTDAELADYNSEAIGLEDLNFLPIDPLDRPNPVNDTSINFANISGFSGISSSYGKNDSVSFRYRNDYNTLIDYIIPSDVVREEIKIARNVGDNTLDAGGNLPVRVKQTDNGWAFDGIHYSCEFYVFEDSGKTINLGQNSAEIDGVLINGQVILSKGFHRIKTHKENWRGIAPGDMTTTDNPDILYPYNHKYLIEGVSDTLYGDDMTATISSSRKIDIMDPDEMYTGVARYWEKVMEEVTIFDFTQNVDNDYYNAFAFVVDLNGEERIMVKESQEPGLLTAEKLAIITRTVSSDLHKAIVLKTVLSSEDSKATPVLDEYIVRLGL